MTSALRLLLTALVVVATQAAAADLHVTLPALTVVPGATVDLPIEVNTNPSGMNVYSLDYRLVFNPAVVASSQPLPEGFLYFWGPPFVNGTSSFAAGAAAGLTPLVTGEKRMHAVRVVVRPDAPPGSVMPLTFSALRFNEGSPSVDYTPGSLTVTTSAGAGSVTPALALLAPYPEPSGGPLRLGFTLPEPTNVRLTLHDVQGRTLAVLASGVRASGTHAWWWEPRDARGAALPPGLYLLRLEAAGRVHTRRLVRLRG